MKKIKTSTIGKFIKKIFLIAFLLLLGSSIGTYVFLQTEQGQKTAASIAGCYLSNLAGTEVSLEEVHISILGDVSLLGLEVQDHRGNSLFSSYEIALTQLRYSPTSLQWDVSSVDFDQPKVLARKYEGDQVFNYQKIGRSPKDEEGSASPFITIGEVDVKDGSFKHFDELVPFKESTVQKDHILIDNLDAEVSNLRIEPDQVSAQLDFLTLNEKSGFSLDHLAGNLGYSSERLSLLNLIAISSESKLDGKIVTEWPEDGGSSIVEDWQWDVNFRHFEVSPAELAQFSENEIPIKEKLGLRGKLEGKLNSPNLEEMEIWFGEDSFVDGDYRLRDIKNFPEVFLDWEVRDGKITHHDMKRFYPGFPMMEELERLKWLGLDGRMTGFFTDFVLHGDFNTGLGKTVSDINFELIDDPEKLKYSGDIELHDFDLGTYIGEKGKNLGKTSLKASLEGKGVELNHLNFDFSTQVSSIQIGKNVFEDLAIDGQFDKQLFQGDIDIDDPKLKADFDGTLNFNAPSPLLDFKLDLQRADLQALDLTDSKRVLNTYAEVNSEGLDLDNHSGHIRLIDGKLQTKKEVQSFDSLRVESQALKDGRQKELSFYSDMIIGNLEGAFKYQEIPGLTLYALSDYMSADILPFEKDLNIESSYDQALDFNVHFHEPGLLTALLIPELEIGQNTHLRGEIGADEPSFTLNGFSPYLAYEDVSMEGLSIEGDGSGKWLDLINSAHNISQNGETLIDEWRFDGKSTKDSLSFEAFLEESRKGNTQLTLGGNLEFGEQVSDFQMESSELVVEDTEWDLSASEIKYYSDSIVSIEAMQLINGEQEIMVSGNINRQLDHPLDITLKDFDWENAHPYFSGFPLAHIEGEADGDFAVSDLRKNPRINGYIDFEPAYLKSEKLGTATVRSEFDLNNEVNQLSGSFQQEGQDILTFNGDLDIEGDDNDLFVHLISFPAANLEPYFDDVASNIEGELYGNARVFGDLSRAEMDGSLRARETYFTVDYLQTRYSFSGEISMTDSIIPLNNAVIEDSRGNEAQINGAIRHRMFDNQRYDVRVDANNFQVLNTTEDSEEDFYGTGYGTGRVSFQGTQDDLLMELSLRSEPNTRLTIPNHTHDEDVAKADYIRFSDPYGDDRVGTFMDFSPEGMEFDMDFEFTPDAEITLEFDAFGRDVLRGRGDGNIRMTYEEGGAFNIYGDYNVEEGEYVFTLADLVRKRFKLEEGGTISWSGNPYEANLDLEASYRQRVSSADLMPQGQSGPEGEGGSPTQIPVIVKAHLLGPLEAPDIQLDLEAEDHVGVTDMSNLNLQSAIQRIRADEQELEQQIISLLVLNRFLPRGEEQDLLATGVDAGIGELVSAQVGGFLSEFYDDLHMGVHYRSGEGDYSRELEVVGSTRLMDDRLGITGSYDFEDAARSDLEVNYRLSERGRYQVKAFRRNNENYLVEEGQSGEIWGFGVSFRHQFDSIGEIWRNEKSENQEDPEKEEEHAQEELSGDFSPEPRQN